jgi:hypothetical protein
MWYLSSALKPIGPFSLADVQDKIKKGQVGPSDLVYNQNIQAWKPAIEWDDIRRLGFPAFESVKTDSFHEPIWVVLHKSVQDQTYKQEGPFAGTEIARAVQAGEFSMDDLVWKKGLSGWARLGDREEFTSPDL